MPAVEMMVRQAMDYLVRDIVNNLLLTVNKSRRADFSGFCFLPLTQ